MGSKNNANKKKVVEWKATQTANLVRRFGAVYYAQIKIAGKTYRKSLGTEKLDVARLKLAIKLNEIRADAEKAVAFRQGGVDGARCATLGGCLELWLDGEGKRPGLKKSTVQYNERRFNDLMRELPTDVAAGKVSVEMFRDWWRRMAEHYNPTYANNLLSIARILVDMQVRAGLVRVNPLLDFKWLKIPKVIRVVASGEQMAAMLADMRAQPSRFADESADMAAMMAYSGMRPGEVQRLVAKDLLEDVIMVRMSKEGTKNYEERSVPIMAEIREVVARRRSLVGSIWSIKSPENAMRRSCKRLGFGFVVTRYSCRHFFATRCLESGVDVPTVAKWLGHKDGGITLMKAYSHVTDAHGLEVAKSVRFG